MVMKRFDLGGSRCVLLGWLVLAAMAPAAIIIQRVQAEEAAAAKNDLFVVPEGDAQTIHAYMKKLANTAPEGKTEDEQIAFSVKALSALVEASDRLLAAKPDDKLTAEAFAYKLEALQVLVDLEQADFRAPLEEAIKAAQSDSHEEVVAMGWQALINTRTKRWTDLDAATRKAFGDAIVEKLEADGAQPLDASIVKAVALELDHVDDAFVADLLERSLPLLQKSDDPSIKAVIDEVNFEGMLRRLTLVGKPMEISGDLLQGGKIDWASYRGKVVLVDFWASWCKPCRQELPNVLAMYDAYHDKGFDVVGVSLDATPEDAKKAVRELNLKWDSIFPADENQREYEHPLVRRYGVNGIPTAILVDKDGRAVHLQARGEALRDELKKLLGDPAGKPAESDAKPAS
jgi:thiol-disulfide isomerase/thioredoxin